MKAEENNYDTKHGGGQPLYVTTWDKSTGKYEKGIPAWKLLQHHT